MTSKKKFMIRMSGILLAVIFAVISLFHLYWATGGTFGSRVVVPTVAVPSRGQMRVFKPSVGGTVLVAGAFLLALAVILGQLRFLGAYVPHRIFRWGTWAIALLFLLRAIGEFRLVGFFKQVRDTPFAHWDTWLFSPLCLFIAIIAFVLAYTEA
ncbi:MAG TPA: DUF3995 domain-containing protein [Pyrinomonadaceae bacterium]